MSPDHYVAYLNAEIRELRMEVARQTKRADKNQRIIDAVLEGVHPKCTAETCATVAAVEREL